MTPRPSWRWNRPSTMDDNQEQTSPSATAAYATRGEGLKAEMDRLQTSRRRYRCQPSPQPGTPSRRGASTPKGGHYTGSRTTPCCRCPQPEQQSCWAAAPTRAARRDHCFRSGWARIHPELPDPQPPRTSASPGRRATVARCQRPGCPLPRRCAPLEHSTSMSLDCPRQSLKGHRRGKMRSRRRRSQLGFGSRRLLAVAREEGGRGALVPGG